MMTTPIIGSQETHNTRISAAYTRRQQEKLEKNLSYLVENYVALEDIDPTQKDTFPKVLESLSVLDDKLQKLKETMPKTAQTADQLWEELRESVEVRKPVKAKVKENLVNVVEFYAFLYEQASNRVTTPKFLQTQGQEHQRQGTWEKEFFIKEIRGMSDRQAVSLTLGTPRVKHLVVLDEAKLFLQEFKVDNNKIALVQQAIKRLEELMKKYPQLKTLKATIDGFDTQIEQIMGSEEPLMGPGLYQAEKTLVQANFLYGALRNFLTRDMGVILNLKDLKPAQVDPDKSLKQILGDANSSKIEQIIQNRLKPGTLNWLKSTFTAGFKPDLDDVLKNHGGTGALAQEIMELTYNQLKGIATDAAALPDPKPAAKAVDDTIKAAAPEAPPKAQNSEQTLRAKYKENPVWILNSQEYATILEPKAVQLMNLARNNNLNGFWNLVDDLLKPKAKETPAPQTATTPATTPPPT